jgi:T5SS/PEP-CTERM-associated repeat protein
MKTRIIAAIALLLVAQASLPVTAHAQYTDNNQTNTISAVSSNWAGDYYVGDGFAYDALLIQTVGVLSNGNGYIGFNGNFNTVLASDPGSVWSNANDLYVGFNGGVNSLTVTNGATVYNGYGYIGYEHLANANTVLVTDPGSVWNNANDLSVGYLGVGNSLTVTNGGKVYNYYSYIGNQANADDNAVLVTGSGSVWNNVGALYVGYLGAENSLTVTNGGIVTSYYGLIGSQSGANNNTVLVAGSGSVWNNGKEMDVGSYGSGNSLIIADGGAVVSGPAPALGPEDSSIGNSSGANNNTALVAGSGSVWSNAHVLFVGLSGSGNSLTVTNGGAVYSRFGLIGDQYGANNNTALVTGSGSVWSNAGDLYVGNAGAGNSLTIAANGSVVAQNAYVGYYFQSGNFISVSGGGFYASTLDIGSGTLTLNDGIVTVVNLLMLTNGVNSVLTFNAGTLNGGNTLASASPSFTVGDGSDPAVFHLSGGVHVFLDGPLEIQNNGSLTGCGSIYGTLQVDAGGTVLADCGGTLTIFGTVTNNGSIVATNGTTINFYGTVVDNGQIGPSNSVHYYPPIVQTNDTNSWITTNSDKWEADFNWSAGAPFIGQPALYITNATSKTVTADILTGIAFTNTLAISNLTVSAPLNSTNTLLLNSMGVNTPLQIASNLNVNTGGIVSVVNSALEIDGSGAPTGISGLSVGVSTAGEQLNIQGGQVGDIYGFMGFNSSSSNNTALVSGPGSVWSNAGSLFVGYASAGNSLTIASGGTVYNSDGTIGNAPGANSNTALVTGSGSVWSNAFFLIVGYAGAGNSLTITNGGTVYDEVGLIGYGANNNSILVTGPGSVWRNTEYLDVGTSTAGNSLTISNGGAVYDGSVSSTIVGWFSSTNLVTVTGNGAVWDILGALDVGDGGSSNQLVIGNGGTVIASNAVIGLDNSYFASNNVLQVNGGSLFVTNSSESGQLCVGQSTGPGVLILNSGTVTVNQLVVTNGANGVFTFNAGTLTSSGTSVTNSQLFVVGDGTDAATFHLNGGVHSFANNLEISNNATLSGCGTIEGNVTIDPGGTVLANCGGKLTFTGIVTNNGTMLAVNGTALQFDGQVVNNGTINAIDGSAQFLGGLVDNGCVLTETNVQISSITRSATNITVQIPSAACGTYQLQVTPSLKPPTWTNLGTSQGGNGGLLTFTDTNGATNRPSRFYRIDVTLP